MEETATGRSEARGRADLIESRCCGMCIFPAIGVGSCFFRGIVDLERMRAGRGWAWEVSVFVVVAVWGVARPFCVIVVRVRPAHSGADVLSLCIGSECRENAGASYHLNTLCRARIRYQGSKTRRIRRRFDPALLSSPHLTSDIRYRAIIVTTFTDITLQHLNVVVNGLFRQSRCSPLAATATPAVNVHRRGRLPDRD
jgi:hypothetical protein